MAIVLGGCTNVIIDAILTTIIVRVVTVMVMQPLIDAIAIVVAVYELTHPRCGDAQVRVAGVAVFGHSVE